MLTKEVHKYTVKITIFMSLKYFIRTFYNVVKLNVGCWAFRIFHCMISIQVLRLYSLSTNFVRKPHSVFIVLCNFITENIYLYILKLITKKKLVSTTKLHAKLKGERS